MDDSLGKLRAFSGLAKVCRLFLARHDAKSVKVGDRRALRSAFTAYKTNPRTRELARLPWCLASLELLAAIDMAQDPPVHPADSFPVDETMRSTNCTMTQWSVMVQDIVLCLLEEHIKHCKCTPQQLKDI